MIENITNEERRTISKIACDVGFERERVISTFVATTIQIKEGTLAANPILDRIEIKGVPL